jgi:hypothetical protein
MKEIVTQLSEKITNAETRLRSRTAEEYQRFLYAIEYILTDIWKASYIHPEAECSIYKYNNHYSSNKRYRDPNLTYKMTMAAFDGLESLNLIVVTKKGNYDRTIKRGEKTRYRPREELLEMLNEIPEHPAIHLKPNLDEETIILRNVIDGKKVFIDYKKDCFTQEFELVNDRWCLVKSYHIEQKREYNEKKNIKFHTDEKCYFKDEFFLKHKADKGYFQ